MIQRGTTPAIKCIDERLAQWRRDGVLRPYEATGARVARSVPASLEHVRGFLGGEQGIDVLKDLAKALPAKKPIFIGEMASAEEGGDKAAWIDAIVATLKAQYPLIKAVVNP